MQKSFDDSSQLPTLTNSAFYFDKVRRPIAGAGAFLVNDSIRVQRHWKPSQASQLSNAFWQRTIPELVGKLDLTTSNGQRKLVKALADQNLSFSTSGGIIDQLEERIADLLWLDFQAGRHLPQHTWLTQECGAGWLIERFGNDHQKDRFRKGFSTGTKMGQVWAGPTNISVQKKGKHFILNGSIGPLASAQLCDYLVIFPTLQQSQEAFIIPLKSRSVSLVSGENEAGMLSLNSLKLSSDHHLSIAGDGAFLALTAQLWQSFRYVTTSLGIIATGLQELAALFPNGYCQNARRYPDLFSFFCDAIMDYHAIRHASRLSGEQLLLTLGTQKVHPDNLAAHYPELSLLVLATNRTRELLAQVRTQQGEPLLNISFNHTTVNPFPNWGQSSRVSVIKYLVEAILEETIPLRQSLRAVQQGNRNDKNSQKDHLTQLIEHARLCSMFALRAGLLKWGRDICYTPTISNLYFSICDVLTLLGAALVDSGAENEPTNLFALHYSQRLYYHLETLAELIEDVDFHQQLLSFHQSRIALQQSIGDENVGSDNSTRIIQHFLSQLELTHA